MPAPGAMPDVTAFARSTVELGECGIRAWRRSSAKFERWRYGSEIQSGSSTQSDPAADVGSVTQTSLSFGFLASQQRFYVELEALRPCLPAVALPTVRAALYASLMLRATIAFALVSAVPVAGCTPVAVGAVVAGGGSLVSANILHEDDCEGEGCRYGNALAFMLMVIGLSLLVGGGIYLGVSERD